MSEPIRILHIVTRMDAAGIETLLMNFYRNINRTRVQFDFLTHREDKGFYDNEIEELGGNIYHVPSINPFKHAEYIKSLNNFFYEKKNIYNIVHSHINTYSMYPLRSAKKAGIPIRIAHSHIANVPFGLKTPFRIYTKSRIKQFSNYNFACSNMAGEWLFGRKAITKNNFKLVTNSIDSEKYIYNQNTKNKLIKEMNLNDNFIIGHIGRFTKQKNHRYLIDVFSEIYKKNPKAILLLVGDGPLRTEMEMRVLKLNLQDAVIFTGVKSNIHELLQLIDVFVLPSLFEGLGIVAIEAQAAGVPCIVSNKVPKEAFITNRIRSLSLNLDKELWANEILKLNGHSKKNTYRQIVDSGYDIKEQAKKIEEFYLKVN
ncbi:glycosyltransferase family 1 protein [Oceanobacillus kimchii]|uniref:glycosyltransferase family 1 protein n=1 Tax=Oceanobacillus kimchii TaxID=746691 RepID=UPI003B0287E1